MSVRKIITTALVITLSVISSASYAKSSVWKISKGNKYFYLGGTVHLLSPSDYPLPKEFSIAYKDSEKLIFETDMAETHTPEFQGKLFSKMMYASDKSLSSDLSKDTYSKLKSFLEVRGMPIETFSTFQPWAVALTATVMEYQRLGLMAEYGVETHFTKLATEDNKTLGELESVEEQISFLASMGSVEPNLVINYTLQDLEQLPEFATFMKKNWRSGDVEAFTTHKLIVEMKEEFPEIYNTLVVNRNNDWMKEITTLNNNNIIEFVLVGAMHLNGKEGLLNQLSSAGYTVNQL